MAKCKLFALALMIIAAAALVACGHRMNFSDEDMDIYEKIHRYYSKMESYSAQVTLTVKGNKTENIYKLEQYAKGEDRTLSRIVSPEELNGLETVTNGEMAQVRFGGEKPRQLDVTASKDMDCTFISYFMRYYYQSEDTVIQVNTGQENTEGTTLLETELPPVSARRSRASLLVDNRTLAPKCITVYDMGGNIVLIAEFDKFVYNDTIQDEIFEIAS